MRYNESLKKEIAPFLVDAILRKIDENSEAWNLVVNSWKIKLSNKDFDYFKNEQKSCLAELVVDYTISSKGGDNTLTRDEQVSIFIPQLIKSSFVLDGKTRTHESYFDKGNDLNIGQTYISFDGCTYRIKDDAVNFYVRGLGTQLLPLEDIDDPANYNDPEFYKKLSLSTRQRKKIEIIYGFDPGKKLTKEILVKMAHAYTMSMRDHVITKQLITVDRALYMHLEKVAFKLIRSISAQFYKAGNLYITGLQSAIYNFFKGRSESVNPVHYPESFNELTYLIASKKVILETGADQKKELKVAKTRYNPTFFDVVDAGVTPDGKNINKKNELAQAIEVNADGSINIKVFNKDFKEVSIEFLDYMLAKVLHYEEVDYRKGKIISKKGPWKVKHKGETMENPSFDYIDLHPDERLATTSRMIPMMNSTDSVRVSMSAKMMSQAISTRSSEAPLIATGHENIKEESPLAVQWTSEETGMVTKSDTFKGIIEIEKSNGELVKYKLPSPIEVQKKLVITFNGPEVGEVLKKGDLVYRSSNMAKDGQTMLGQNLFTAFMYWRGLEFEDSVVISETCSNKLTHIGEHILEYDIKVGEELKTLLQPGKLVSSLKKEYLVSVLKKLSYTRSQEGLNNLVRTTHEYTKEVGLKLPNDLVDTILVDVKYIEVTPDAEIKGRLDRVSNMDYRTAPGSEYLRFAENHGDISTREMVLPTTTNLDEMKGVAYRVYLKIVIANPCKAGDKITNR